MTAVLGVLLAAGGTSDAEAQQPISIGQPVSQPACLDLRSNAVFVDGKHRTQP